MFLSIFSCTKKCESLETFFFLSIFHTIKVLGEFLKVFASSSDRKTCRVSFVFFSMVAPKIP